MRSLLRVACAALVAASGCDLTPSAQAKQREQAAPAVEAAPAASAAPLYSLHCGHALGTVLCMRTNTSTGDVRRIDLDRLPQTAGSTAEAAQGAGSYQLACETALRDDGAAFSCVRLDTRTGELVRIHLPSLGSASH